MAVCMAILFSMIFDDTNFLENTFYVLMLLRDVSSAAVQIAFCLYKPIFFWYKFFFFTFLVHDFR